MKRESEIYKISDLKNGNSQVIEFGLLRHVLLAPRRTASAVRGNNSGMLREPISFNQQTYLLRRDFYLNVEPSKSCTVQVIASIARNSSYLSSSA